MNPFKISRKSLTASQRITVRNLIILALILIVSLICFIAYKSEARKMQNSQMEETAVAGKTDVAGGDDSAQQLQQATLQPDAADNTTTNAE